MSLEKKISELEQEFQSYSDWEDRYKKIIEMGKNLPEMPEQMKSEQNLVKGCQSQVWLFAKDNEDGTVTYFADSDASIAKGIIALLLNIFSDNQPQDILTVDDSFIDRLGLRQHLSMNRANGLNAMLKQIKIYAVALKAKMDMMK